MKQQTINKLHQVTLAAGIALGGVVRADITTTGQVYSTDTLYVGDHNDGTVIVDGGSSYVSSYAVLGNYSGATGTVTVSGSSSSWSNTYLDIGSYGTGNLNVYSGGSVNSSGSESLSEVGHGTGSIGMVTVSGNGSTWNASSGIIVGDVGSGTLYISAGGIVNSDALLIGDIGTGTVTVSGSGSKLSSGSALNVGYGSLFGHVGTGTLNIADHARVDFINHGPNNTPSITVASYSGDTGTINLQGGVLDIDGGSVIMGGGNSYFNFIGGTFQNASEFSGDLAQKGGTFAIGSGSASASATTVSGNYTQDTGATLLFGMVGGQSDLLIVTGAASLAGRLDVSLIGGDIPHGSCTVLHAIEGISGAFSNVIDGKLATALGTFDVTYNPNSVELSDFKLADTATQIGSNAPTTFVSAEQPQDATPDTGKAVVTLGGTDQGTINITYAAAPGDSTPDLPTPDFALVGDQWQSWEVGYSGTLDSDAELVFTYNATGMTLEQQEALGIYHYHDGQWELMPGSVNTMDHTITLTTDSFSPFALGAVPEPASLSLLALGGLLMLRRRRRA